MAADIRSEKSFNDTPGDAPAIRAGKALVDRHGNSSKLVKGMRLAKPAIEVFGKQLALICAAKKRAIEECSRRIQEIMRKGREDLADEIDKIIAEMNAAQEVYEADWLENTGVIPPRITLENIDQCVAWWRKQALRARIDIDTSTLTRDTLFSQLNTLEPRIRKVLELYEIQMIMLQPISVAEDEVFVDLRHESDGFHWIINGEDTGRVSEGALTIWSKTLFENVGRGFIPHWVFARAMGVKDDEYYLRSHPQNLCDLRKLVDVDWSKEHGMRLPPQMRKPRIRTLSEMTST